MHTSDPVRFERVFTPPARAGGPVGHLGTLRQVLPVSVDRLFENALDWEHLPWVHGSSFTSIEKIEAGDWGWRVHAGMTNGGAHEVVELELRLEREHRRWITTTLSGSAAGSEIWTHVSPVADRSTSVVVDFFAPGLPKERVEYAGRTLQHLYRRLYDEDVLLMLDRQAAVDEHEHREAVTPMRLVLGTEAEIRSSLPYTFECFGRSWRVVEVDTTLVAHAGRCPHQLGSLLDAAIHQGEIVCPWHGYRFDLSSGACVSGARCRLEPPPRIRIEGADVLAEFG